MSGNPAPHRSRIPGTSFPCRRWGWHVRLWIYRLFRLVSSLSWRVEVEGGEQEVRGDWVERVHQPGKIKKRFLQLPLHGATQHFLRLLPPQVTQFINFISHLPLLSLSIESAGSMPWQSTTPTKNKSNILPGMQAKLSLQLCRNCQRDWSPTCGAPTTGHPGFPCTLEYPQEDTVLFSILLFSFNKETLLQLQVWRHTKLHSFVTLIVENGLELG